MRPKTFSAIDFVSSVAAALFLLFLFIYPHMRLNAMRDDIVPLCDAVIEAVGAEAWEDALSRGEEMRARIHTGIAASARKRKRQQRRERRERTRKEPEQLI